MISKTKLVILLAIATTVVFTIFVHQERQEAKKRAKHEVELLEADLKNKEMLASLQPELNTFKYPQFNFEFKYPQKYTIKESKGVFTIYPGQKKFGFTYTIKLNVFKGSLESLIGQTKYITTEENSWNGLRWFKKIAKCNGWPFECPIHYFTYHNGTIVHFETQQDLDTIMRDIVATLEFLPSAETYFEPKIIQNTTAWKTCTPKIPTAIITFKYPKDWVRYGSDCSSLNPPDQSVQSKETSVFNVSPLSYDSNFESKIGNVFEIVASNSKFQLLYRKYEESQGESYYLVKSDKSQVIGFSNQANDFNLTPFRKKELHAYFENIISTAKFIE